MDVDCSKQSSSKNTKDDDSVKNKIHIWAIFIVFAAFFSNIILDGIIYTMGMIEDELLVEFNESKSFTSLVPSIMSGMELCVGPLASFLINKYSCRTVAIIGSILGAVSFVISGYMQNIFSLILTVGLGVGTALGFIYIAVIVSLLTNFDKYRSVATGFALSGTGVGSTTFAPLVAFLIEKFGWRGCLMTLGIILLNCSLLGAFFRQPKASRKNQNLNNISEEEISQAKQDSTINNEFENQKHHNYLVAALESISKFMNLNLLKNPVFILFIVSDFLTSMCLYVPYYSLPSYANTLGTKEDGPRILMITGIMNILGPFVIGYISNKSSNRLWIYIACLIICSIAIAVFVICSNFLSLAICSAVFAFNMGACVSLRSVILSDLLGLKNIENAFGLLLLFEGIGTFIGPPIDGFLHDLSNSYTPGFLFTSVIIAFSGFILVPMPALVSYVKKKHLRHGNLKEEKTKLLKMANDEKSQQKSDGKIENGNTVQEPSSPIDGGWGYVIVVASFVINFISDGIVCSFGLIYIQLLEEFNEGKAYTSMILSIMSGMALCAGPISSIFVNKYGIRAVTIAGSILAALSLFASSYAENVFTLIITIGFSFGFSLGLVYLPAIVSVTTYFEKYRSIATGIAVAGSGLGTFVFAPLVEFLVQEYSWRKTLMVLSGIVLNCALFGGLFRPLPPSTNTNSKSEQYSPKKDQITELESQQNSNHEHGHVKLKEMCCTHLTVKIYKSCISLLSLELLKDPVFILFAVSDFTNALGYYIPFFCIVDHATELNISKDQASYLLSIIGIANTLSRLIMGYISDKSWVDRLWLYNISLVICGLATVASVLCTNFYELSIYAAVFGFSIGAYVALRSVILVDLIGLEKLNNAFGLLMLIEGIATFIGPPLVGCLYDILHSYTPGFLLAGLTIALSGFILFFMPSLLQNISQKRQHDMEMS
ncbi:monocarboxylate transporter 14-like [Contarinia nasturtii]|uniref:monocarboxylate transporter 14-like n=1 Tax=Contarinia nasturtii TaxID=265458 RepID=UPI0012D4AF9E|nr:monocarboxylate transporter 14-like [Contarinia nasturtii]